MGGEPLLLFLGAVAQLGERQLCKLDVVGSNPISSTVVPARSLKTAYEG
jgi:hypothetical protein